MTSTIRQLAIHSLDANRVQVPRRLGQTSLEELEKRLKYCGPEKTGLI